MLSFINGRLDKAKKSVGVILLVKLVISASKIHVLVLSNFHETFPKIDDFLNPNKSPTSSLVIL